VIDRLVKGIRKAGLFAIDYSFYKLSQENMLDGEEIRKLFFGKKVTGSYESFFKKVDFYVERTKDGKSTWTVPVNSLDYGDSGKSWIEDDMLCDQWNIHFSGTKYCMSVFRNPEENFEKKNKYIAVSDTDFIKFGVVE
jgi:hypothetical protein